MDAPTPLPLDLAMAATALLLILRGAPVALTLAGVGVVFTALAALLRIEPFFTTGDIGVMRAVFHRVYGLMDSVNEPLTAIPLFILMGVLLERSGVARGLIETMGALLSGVRGGLGAAVTVVGVLLAATTGVVGATVVALSVIALPSMLRQGYAPGFAAGSVAASGALGQIIPPSIVLVAIGESISAAHVEARRAAGDWAPDPVSTSELFLGALLPGLLLALLYLAYQLIAPRVVDGLAPPLSAAQPVAAKRVLTALAAPAALIIAVMGSILGGVATPAEAAGLGALGALLLAGVERTDGRADPRPALIALLGAAAALAISEIVDTRLAACRAIAGCDGAWLAPVSDRALDHVAISLAALGLVALAYGLGVSLARLARRRTTDGVSVLAGALQSSLRLVGIIFAIVIGAMIFTLAFRALGGADRVEAALSALPGGATGAMLAVMIAIFLLGFVMEAFEIIFVVIPIAAPALFALGLDPIWVAVMIGLNLQASFLTPPFGVALFYLRGAAPPELRTADIYRGVAPFVALQLAALALLAAAPSLALWAAD